MPEFKNKSKDYERLFSRAMNIYHKIRVKRIPFYPQSWKTLSFDEFGQVVGLGQVRNVQRKEQMPDEDVQALNKAINLYRRASEICPNKGGPYKWMGRSFQLMGHYDEAIENYKIAIKNFSQYKEELTSRIQDCEDLKIGAYEIEYDLSQDKN